MEVLEYQKRNRPHRESMVDNVVAKLSAKINDEDCGLLSESALTEEQVIALVWEAIIETSDPPMVATEWAMYEIAKNPTKQNQIYQEIQNVCGSEKIKEEDLQHLRYLNAAFHETLRLYPPVPMTLPSHVHEDTQLGGYNIPAGTDVIHLPPF